jgi:hydrogenase maturation factor
MNVREYSIKKIESNELAALKIYGEMNDKERRAISVIESRGIVGIHSMEKDLKLDSTDDTSRIVDYLIHLGYTAKIAHSDNSSDEAIVIDIDYNQLLMYLAANTDFTG